MRISDWSSDVCSSDLHWRARRAPSRRPALARTWPRPPPAAASTALAAPAARARRRLPPAWAVRAAAAPAPAHRARWRSEEHTSELQSLMRISYAVFCLKKKNKHKRTTLGHLTQLDLVA